MPNPQAKTQAPRPKVQKPKIAHENESLLPLKKSPANDSCFQPCFRTSPVKSPPKKPHNSRENDHSQHARKIHPRISRRIRHVIFCKKSFSRGKRNLPKQIACRIGKYYFQENPIILGELHIFSARKIEKTSKTPCLIFGKIPQLQENPVKQAFSQLPNNNDQRPTTNDQRSTTNDQRSTTNDQRPTTNDQRPTTNDQRSTINDQRSTINDQRSTTNDQQPTTTSPHPPEKSPTQKPRIPRKNGMPLSSTLKKMQYSSSSQGESNLQYSRNHVKQAA
jgi:hypothetical protein